MGGQNKCGGGRGGGGRGQNFKISGNIGNEWKKRQMLNTDAQS